MKAAIEVADLGKMYRIERLTAAPSGVASGAKQRRYQEEFWALRDVSFRVEPGERMGIIGRNGAGKSTLLKLLSRITGPTQGRIAMRGRVASLLEVGTGFHPELTGRENIFINGSVLGMRRREIRERFDEIVAFSDTGHLLDTPVKRYSSGQYMRLAFAVAAHLDPDVLLVDEVLAVGDAAFQAKCLGKMDSISREGRTVVFVSHDMSAVATLCDRAILLQPGAEAISGDAESVITSYRGLSSVSEDLAGRSDRSGNGHARVLGLNFRDGAGPLHGALSPRVPLEIVVQLRLSPEARAKPVNVQLTASDSKDNRLFSLSSAGGPPLRAEEGSISLVCLLAEGVPLMPDHYTFDVLVSVDGVVADKMANALRFEVVAKDIFGTGVLPTKNMGPLIVAHRWQPAL